ncbi:MAG: hypothetical protein ABFS56_15780 [Pseudomonadota bacterium]
MNKNTQHNNKAKAVVLSGCFFIMLATSAVAQIRSGFDANIVPANDDGSTGLIPLGFTINFFGTTYSAMPLS